MSEYEEKLTRQEEDLRKVIAEKLSEIGALKSKINQEQIQFQQEIVKLQVQMNNAISNAKSLEKQNSDLLAEKIMHKEQKENIEAEVRGLIRQTLLPLLFFAPSSLLFVFQESPLIASAGQLQAGSLLSELMRASGQPVRVMCCNHSLFFLERVPGGLGGDLSPVPRPGAGDAGAEVSD